MQETAEDAHPGAPTTSRGELTLVAFGPDRLHSVALCPETEVVVGRDASCQLSLTNPALSRFHARFARHGARVTLEDLGSRNGTWLYGNRVERAELALGASARLGDVVVALTCGAPGMAPAAEDAPLFPGALYLSTPAREARSLLRRVAPAQVPVLLHGETGTGKELAAREIHLASGRKGPLRVLNCAAIPPQLIESTLFGHERGAFTGAERSRSGIFEDANGGTLLLDEIGELSLAAQAALLRVIETGRVARVGSNQELALDVRLVSATHRDLQAMTALGEFRLDLFHRLCVITVVLPSLRARRAEIAALGQFFRSQQAGARDHHPRAMSFLEAYDWPGNIRELRNVLARAAALARGPCIGTDDLPDALRESSDGDRRTRAPTRSQTRAIAPQALRDYLKRVEHGEVERALAQSGGNQGRAAALLGISPRTFRRRVRAMRDAQGGRS
jgi:DNA-binding NtrC family response regulator